MIRPQVQASRGKSIQNQRTTDSQTDRQTDILDPDPELLESITRGEQESRAGGDDIEKMRHRDRWRHFARDLTWCASDNLNLPLLALYPILYIYAPPN